MAESGKSNSSPLSLTHSPLVLSRHHLLPLFEDPFPRGNLKPGYARGKNNKVWVCPTDRVSVQEQGTLLPFGQALPCETRQGRRRQAALCVEHRQEKRKPPALGTSDAGAPRTDNPRKGRTQPPGLRILLLNRPALWSSTRLRTEGARELGERNTRSRGNADGGKENRSAGKSLSLKPAGTYQRETGTEGILMFH